MKIFFTSLLPSFVCSLRCEIPIVCILTIRDAIEHIVRSLSPHDISNEWIEKKKLSCASLPYDWDCECKYTEHNFSNDKVSHRKSAKRSWGIFSFLSENEFTESFSCVFFLGAKIKNSFSMVKRWSFFCVQLKNLGRKVGKFLYYVCVYLRSNVCSF